MTVSFFDLQDAEHKKQEAQLSNWLELSTLLNVTTDEPPHLVELVSEHGARLLMGIGVNFGFAQYTNTDGSVPYWITKSEGSNKLEGVEIYMAGDTGTEIPRQYCIPMSSVLGAAYYFFNYGSRDPSIEWEAL